MSAHQKSRRFSDHIADLLAKNPSKPGEDVIDKLMQLGNLDHTFLEWADNVPPEKNDKQARKVALDALDDLWLRLMSYDERTMVFGSRRHVALNEARLAVLRAAVQLDGNRVGRYTLYLLRHGLLFYRAKAVFTYFLGNLGR